MKKLLTVLMVTMVVLGLCTFAVSAEQPVVVTINGVEVDFDVPAQIINNRTLVPLRGIFEVLGAQVNWDGATDTVTAYRGNTSISLQIGSTSLFVNGEEKVIDVPAQLVNNRTLIPARAVAESFGATVDWDGANQKVIIADSTVPDFKAMLEKMENVDDTNMEAKFDVSFAMSDGEEAVNFKADGNVKMIAQPLAAEYTLNVNADGVKMPLAMYMQHEEDELVVYYAIEMNGEKQAMKVAIPAPAMLGMIGKEQEAALNKELFGDYTDIIKVVAQEKVNGKDTVKFVMTITDELLTKAVKLADEQGMYEGLEVDVDELVYPDMELDIYVWLDKETGADVKCAMDLASMLNGFVNEELVEGEEVSFDACAFTMDIVGRGTVKEVKVPEDVKANAIDITEGLETIE